MGAATDVGRAALRIAEIVRLALGLILRGRQAAGPGADLDRAEGLGRASGEAVRALGIEVRVEGKPPPPGVLLASNHLSYLDPIVIASVVPCVPISKAELSRWPLFGAAGRAAGVIFLERGDAGSALAVTHRAQALLGRGLSVLNFPEGTTTRGDTVLRFRPGLFGTALRARADVVPVALAYDPPDLAWTGDATFVPHFLALVARPRSAVRLVFGDPIPAASYQDPASLAEAVRDRVAQLLVDPTPWLKTRP